MGGRSNHFERAYNDYCVLKINPFFLLKEVWHETTAIERAKGKEKHYSIFFVFKKENIIKIVFTSNIV